MNKAIDLYQPKSNLMLDALDKVAVEAHMARVEKGFKTFLITGCNATVGTTTNAINLSICMALSGWKTVLIDADIRKKSDYKHLSDENAFGLTDYLDGMASYEDILTETNYKNLTYIPSGIKIDNSVRLLCSENMEKLLKRLKTEFDYIILDMSSLNVTPDATILLPIVDGTILVSALNETTRRDLQYGINKLSRYPEKIVGMVINKVETKDFRQYQTDYDHFEPKKMKRRVSRALKGKGVRENA
ncbi:MAG: CpsD/CapB family tyrosine-protein kinase [Acetatifactor sp.]|nr:CpsD/CapB family tyrosine-protein kinase [Acetatifactor sp.]